VVIAMLILSLLVVGLNAGVVTLIKSNINSKELTSATSVGYQLFEEFRREDYNAMVAIGSSADTVRERYVRTWYFTTDTAKTKIDCTVRWPLASLKHRVALSTIIAKP
jgi:hypothetical protein